MDVTLSVLNHTHDVDPTLTPKLQQTEIMPHKLIIMHFVLIIISGMHSAESTKQSPEWTILSHVNCFIHGEVTGFQVLLDSLHPCTCNTRKSQWSPPVFHGEVLLACNLTKF